MKLRSQPNGRFLYGLGRFVYRSENQGQSWENLTSWKGMSLLGEKLFDLAVSPRDESEIVVVGTTGVWRSIDGGASWSGLNDSLPNLPVRRLLSLPSNGESLRLVLESDGSSVQVIEWAPGGRTGWRPSQAFDLALENTLREGLSAAFGNPVTAVATQGLYFYAGTAQGQLYSSSDAGRSWRPFGFRGAGPVERIWVSAEEPGIALAALTANGDSTPRILRTTNAGLFWDDLTANLPPGSAHGVAADLSTGAIYAATDRGLFMTFNDLRAATPPTSWTFIGEGLPAVPARDVRLDSAGHRIFAALEAYGVYAMLAPHRMRDPRLASAADYANRAAAPGALFSLVGARVDQASAGQLRIPVLSASETESQIQIPFDAQGSTLALALDATGRRLDLPVPLQPTAPAIFLDPDGGPLLLDADSGLALDAMRPARSRSRIQILATGLGRVTPDWPSGLPAPLEDPPKVQATVRAFLDRVPVEVVRATLAPGYTGFYLVEIELPSLVNFGPAELYLEAAGQPSNRVRVYIEP
jgi:uncharacterized protein (TIGR03437 family)